MYNNSCTVQVLVKGKCINEYLHENETFVEGRKGSTYEIKIINHKTTRVLAVLSVDGLSVITGKPASSRDTGYIIPAKQSITVPGWTLDREEVAKFEFSSNDRSYSSRSDQGDDNLGIIGVKIFDEKVKLDMIAELMKFKQFKQVQQYDDGLRQVNSRCYSSINTSSPIGVGVFDYTSMHAVNMPVGSTIISAPPIDEQIGTGFGKATEFSTKSTEFNRLDSASSTILIRYDTKKNLEARGIQFTKVKKVLLTKSVPDAFPGDRCVPPADWTR